MTLPVEVIGGDDHPPGDSSDGDGGLRMAGVQGVGSGLLPVVVGGDDQLPSIDLDDDDIPVKAGQIFSRDVDPIVYARYMGHVRDAIRISR